MVRVVVEHGPGAVKLLDQQHPDHGVRQGQIGQRQQLMAALPQHRVKTIGAADDERHVLRVVLPTAPFGRQRSGVDLRAFFVQPDAQAVFGNGRVYAAALRRPDLSQGFRSPRLGFDGFEREFGVRRKTFGVVVPGCLGPCRHPLAYSDHPEFHARGLRAALFAGADFLAAGFLAAGLG